MTELLTAIANNWGGSLNMQERKALLALRDELPEVYR